MKRRTVRVSQMMLAIFALSLLLAGLLVSSNELASTVLLLTCIVFACSILGAIYRSGERRASWLGFALFGWGYLILIAGYESFRGEGQPAPITTMTLDYLQPHLLRHRSLSVSPTDVPRVYSQSDPQTSAILGLLARPIAINFANETPLEDVLAYIRRTTAGPIDGGIPMYVDVAEPRAGRLLQSTVKLDMEGVALSTTLALLLKQVGLNYYVDHGVLIITEKTTVPYQRSAFRLIGHCYWALLFAWVGSMAGRWFWKTGDRRDVSS